MLGGPRWHVYQLCTNRKQVGRWIGVEYLIEDSSLINPRQRFALQVNVWVTVKVQRDVPQIPSSPYVTHDSLATRHSSQSSAKYQETRNTFMTTPAATLIPARADGPSGTPPVPRSATWGQPHRSGDTHGNPRGCTGVPLYPLVYPYPCWPLAPPGHGAVGSSMGCPLGEGGLASRRD